MTLSVTKAAAVGFCVVAVLTTAFAQSAPPRNASDRVYSDAQARRGEDAYGGSCASCHGDNLVSVDAEAPSLTGARFTSQWAGKTLAERFTLIRKTMPSTNPGALDDQTSIDILAYILKFNGYPSGDQSLASDSGVLEKIVIDAAPKAGG